MAPPPSYSVAPDNRERSRVLSWGALGGIVVLAVGALVLVFPRSDLLTLLRGQGNQTDQGNRDLTTAYLRNIIRTEPKDLSLRLLLVEKLLDGGELKEARQTLDAALALARSSTAGWADWNRWDQAWWQAQLGQAVDGGKDADIRQAATELLSRLKQSAEGANTPAQVFTSISAASAVAAMLASVQGNSQATLVQSTQAMQHALLARLLGLQSATAQELARGATLALAAGRLPLASDLFFAARRKTAAPEARMQFLQKGVQALLAAGDSRKAWQAALREAQPLPPGDSTWWYLAQLALGAGEPREAGSALRNVIPVIADPTLLANTLNAGQLQLAWDTFAAAGDLNAALLVSEAALLAEPKCALWLERKAQISEWAGKAPQALAVWLELLKRGASARALENIFRLSPMLYDDEALLAAWLALARQKQLGTEEVVKIIETYERLGSVEGALNFLRNLRTRQGTDKPGQFNGERNAQSLSLEAQLLNRAGRPNEVIAILEQLRPTGLSMADAMLLANLQLKKGSLPLALRGLRAARLTGPFNDAYWGLLADVAYETDEASTAQMAIDQLIANGTPQLYQAERAIRLRIDANRLPEALQLAAQLYKRFPEDKIVYAWMDALGGQKTPTGVAVLMTALTEPHRRILEASATFLEKRGGLYAALGKMPEARRDYVRALQIKPDNPPVRTAYLWLLIDQQDRSALRVEIARLSRNDQRSPAYNDVLTALWQLLGEPRQALALMQNVARSRSNDFLWLMNYADVLDTADRQSAALRVRRHAWLLAKRASTRPADQEQARNALLTQLRLASEFAGGPDKARLWRDLGGLLKASQTSAEPAKTKAELQQAQEMVGAWLLSEGRFDAAQRWLWQQHAARLAVPAYQELAVALANNDKAALASLLDKADGPTTNTLSPQDKLSALRALGRQDESASLGTEQALRRAEGLDDEAQRALQQDLLATASSAGVRERIRQDAALTRQEIKTSAQLALSPKLKLTFELSNNSNHTRDTNVIAAVPTRDREARVGMDVITPWGDLKAQALVRDALARVNGLYLQLTTKLNSQASVRMEAARNERSEESSAMALAGVRDRLGVTLNLRASDRFDGQVYLGSNRFRTQTGAALGNSLDAFATGNLYLRRDYPDIRLQSQLRRSVMRATGQPDAPTALLVPGGTTPGVDFFLGPSSTAWSNSIGFGLAQSDPLSSYSRAWRPWGEIGFETRQTLGTTQTQSLLRLGIKGSVRGRDQLNLNLDVRPGTGGLSGAQGVRELRLQYDTYFDR